MEFKIADSSLYNLYCIKHAQKQNRGAKGTTDSERKKCYRSEWAFQSAMELKGKPIPTFANLSEAQKFAKKIYKSKTWYKLFAESGEIDFMNMFLAARKPVVQLKARSTGRGTSGFTNGHSVTLDAKCGMDAYTLIHELTHCLGHMHHGRSFRKALVRMVGTFLGAEYKKELKVQFKKNKLNCGEARKPMSFENWVASRNRMKEMRNKMENGK